MLREIFLKDFSWKLVSLLLAAFIWYTVYKTNEIPTNVGPSNNISPAVTYIMELPVLIEATAADMHLYHVKPEKVVVTVSGPPDIMSVLQANELDATVDLSKFDPATDASEPVYVSVPRGVTLDKVKPDKVEVVVPSKSNQPSK